MNKIYELLVDWDNQEYDDLGVEIMSLVDQPAIGITWQAFSDQGCSCHKMQSLEEDQEMINGIIEILVSVEDLDNRMQIAKDQIRQFIEDGTQWDREDFLTKTGLLDIWDEETPETQTLQDAQEYALQLFQQVGETYSPRDAEITLREKFDTADITITDLIDGITALNILGKRDATEAGVTKYRYAGPSAERNFCKAMLRMNKLYAAEDLVRVGQQMNQAFPTMYPQAPTMANPLENGVAEWLGGVNCKHWFEEVEVFDVPGEPKVVVSKGRAPGAMGRPMHDRARGGRQAMQWQFNDDQMIVIGPSMIPELLIPRRDDDGNIFHVFFSEDTVRRIAKNFLKKNLQNRTDVNHSEVVTQENTLLESWIVEDPEMDKSRVYGFDVPKGTWMVSYKINDPKTWKKIKAGELNGFSIFGDFAEKLIK